MLPTDHNLLQIINAIPQLVWTSDPYGYVDFANQRWYDVTGLTVDTTLGQRWLHAVHHDDRASLQQRWSSALETGQALHTEYRLRLANGDYWWYGLLASAVRDADGSIVKWVGTHTDIDAHKRAADQIVAERQQLYNLFMQAPALIAILRGREGVCELFNPRFRELWGYRDVLGKPMREAWPELEGQNYFEFVEHVYDTGEPVFGNEYPALIDQQSSGTLVEAFFNFVYMPYRNAQGQVEGVMIHGIDVTEQVKARRKVEANEERLLRIVETAAEGIGIVDVDGHLVFANTAAEQILGLERSTITTRTHDDPQWNNLTVSGEPLPSEQHPVSIALRTGQPVYNSELAVDLPERGRVIISINAAPLRDAQGAIVGGIGTFRDVTQQKQAEHERELLVTQLQEALRVRDEFLSIASHELKTPLTSLMVFTQLMQRQAEKNGDSAYERPLSRMESQINKLTKLIADLLDVKKMQLGKIAYSDTRFSLTACVAEAVENMRAVTTKHQLLIEGAIDAPVYGDPDRIGQVISNLVSNAIKYSPAADRIEIRLAEDAGQAIVAVRDYGIGIDQRYQGQIFERFFRVTDDIQQTFPGMGIGLYLSAEIVERHGGRIWVESTRGQGATFSFALPLVRTS